MVGCPLMCTFCPQDRLRGAYGKGEKYLSFPDFVTILHKVPQHVRIDFSGMAEPWVNPSATDMLLEALISNRKIAIYTTLYGMSRTDCGTVIRALTDLAPQVEMLCLHLPDARGNMRGWRHDDDYEANLRDFLELAAARILPSIEIMTMDAGGAVHPDLAHLGIRLGSWLGHTRAGNVGPPAEQPIMAAPRHDAAVSCSFTRFYDQNVVMPNGDVYLCCMDYGLKHRIGNLLEQDYYEMFGTGLGALVSENMRPAFSERSLCKRCDRAQPHRQTGAAQMWRPA